MNKSVGQKSHRFLGPKAFNTLPDEIKIQQPLSKFKRELKTYVYQRNRRDIQQLIER